MATKVKLGLHSRNMKTSIAFEVPTAWFDEGAVQVGAKGRVLSYKIGDEIEIGFRIPEKFRKIRRVYIKSGPKPVNLKSRRPVPKLARIVPGQIWCGAAEPVAEGTIEDISTYHFEQRWQRGNNVRFLKWTKVNERRYEYFWVARTLEIERQWAALAANYGTRQHGQYTVLLSNPKPLPAPVPGRI